MRRIGIGLNGERGIGRKGFGFGLRRLVTWEKDGWRLGILDISGFNYYHLGSGLID